MFQEIYVFILIQMKLIIPERKADSDQKPPSKKFVCTTPTELEVHPLKPRNNTFSVFSNNHC
jgi:hypothetical protein